MAILQIIDQLDAQLENSRRMPMSSLRMVDYKEFKQSIERLRVNVPSAIVEGERTPVSYTHLTLPTSDLV